MSWSTLLPPVLTVHSKMKNIIYLWFCSVICPSRLFRCELRNFGDMELDTICIVVLRAPPKIHLEKLNVKKQRVCPEIMTCLLMIFHRRCDQLHAGTIFPSTGLHPQPPRCRKLASPHRLKSVTLRDVNIHGLLHKLAMTLRSGTVCGCSSVVHNKICGLCWANVTWFLERDCWDFLILLELRAPQDKWRLVPL